MLLNITLIDHRVFLMPVIVKNSSTLKFFLFCGSTEKCHGRWEEKRDVWLGWMGRQTSKN